MGAASVDLHAADTYEKKRGGEGCSACRCQSIKSSYSTQKKANRTITQTLGFEQKLAFGGDQKKRKRKSKSEAVLSTIDANIKGGTTNQ